MEKVPEQKSIFRYRSFRNSDVNSLIQQIETDTFTIRLAHPREFNDPEDTDIALNLDPEMNLQEGFTAYLETSLCNTYIAQKNQTPDTTPEEKRGAIYSAMIKATQGELKTFEENDIEREQAQNVRRVASNVVGNFISVQHTNLSNSLSDTLGVCCFSEDVYNKLMWAHYSEESKGYCLEYDISPIIDIGKSGYGFYPVIYSDNKVDQTDRFLEIACNHLDPLCNLIDELLNCDESIIEEFLDYEKTTAKNVELVIMNIASYIQKYMLEIQGDAETKKMAAENCFIKDTSWEYEKEWRLVMPLSPTASEEERHIKLKPKAIYFGLRMRDEDINSILKAISSSGLNIIPYKMQKNIHTRKLEAICML